MATNIPPHLDSAAAAAAAADKADNAPDNVKLVDARYSPRYGGVIANRKAATLAKKRRLW